MALVTYVFQQDCGANKAGDVVSMEQESAQPLIDAGLLAEATADDVAPGEEEALAEEEEVAPEEEAAVTRAIKDGFKKLESSLVKTAKSKVSGKAGVSVGNFATAKEPVFKNQGQMCRAIYKAHKGDTRSRNMLYAYQQDLRRKAPEGMNETDAADGGYSVIPEWSKEIFSKVKNYPDLLGMTTRQTISGNTLNIPAIDEVSLENGAGNRGGGIRAYYVGEGNTVTTSFPAMTQVQAVLKTLAVIIPVTNQLLEDNSYNLDQFLGEKVGEEFVFQFDYGVISGSGSGEPTGILQQDSLVVVDAEGGQAAASIVYPNIRKMWAALWPASRANCVWLVNPQVFQALLGMTFPTSSGTVSAFGGLTFSAHDEFPMRIFGRPVIECLMSPDFGAEGDIILADLKALWTAEHPTLQVAVSDQVFFTSLQTLFRWVYRYDIKSPWTDVITDFNGHYDYSPFVTLAARGT